MLDDYQIDEAGRPARRSLEVPARKTFLRHDHSEGIRRPRVRSLRARRRRHADRHRQRRDRGDGDGAEFARARRVAAALRDAGAEGSLPAATGRRTRPAVFCAHVTVRGLGRGIDSGSRRAGRARAQGRQDTRFSSSRFRQALHHARTGRDRRRPGLSRVRRNEAGRSAGARHHLRADPGAARGRQHRPAPSPDGQCLHERADRRPRRLRADRVGDRRRSAMSAMAGAC